MTTSSWGTFYGKDDFYVSFKKHTIPINMGTVHFFFSTLSFKGLNLSMGRVFMKIFCYFYKNFYAFDKHNKIAFRGGFFFNVDSFFFIIVNFFNFIFEIKSVYPAKILKKKKENTDRLGLFFLTEFRRHKYFFKFIKAGYFLSKISGFYNFIFVSFLDIFFCHQNSLVYNRKKKLISNLMR